MEIVDASQRSEVDLWRERWNQLTLWLEQRRSAHVQWLAGFHPPRTNSEKLDVIGEMQRAMKTIVGVSDE